MNELLQLYKELTNLITFETDVAYVSLKDLKSANTDSQFDYCFEDNNKVHNIRFKEQNNTYLFHQVNHSKIFLSYNQNYCINLISITDDFEMHYRHLLQEEGVKKKYVFAYNKMKVKINETIHNDNVHFTFKVYSGEQNKLDYIMAFAYDEEQFQIKYLTEEKDYCISNLVKTIKEITEIANKNYQHAPSQYIKKRTILN